MIFKYFFIQNYNHIKKYLIDSFFKLFFIIGKIDNGKSIVDNFINA